MLEIPQAQSVCPTTMDPMSETDQPTSDLGATEQTAQSSKPSTARVPGSDASNPPRHSNESHSNESDPPRGPSWMSWIFLMMCVLFLAAWFVGPRIVEEYQFASTKGKLRAEYENAVTILEGQPLKQVSLASQLVAQKAKPSVVSIWSKKKTENEEAASPNGRRRRQRENVAGYGSGVIMSEDGYIVTSAHVTSDSNEFRVVLHDRRSYSAVEIGRDESSDIAVLKIEARGLIPASWGDSEKLEVGSIVWAVGSPYRYQQTVTSGIISAKNRVRGKSPDYTWRRDRDEKAKNLLQTDAAINEGSSGGPLVNGDGNVVGINVSIYGESFQGISFAVPSSTARFVYEHIAQRGKVVRGFLGAEPRNVRHYEAERLGLPDLEGAMLVRVTPGSPADLAGLQRYDVVRAWNEIPIHQYNSLYRLAERTQPGSVVEVSLIRNGQPHVATVTVGETPADYSTGLKVEVQDQAVPQPNR